MIYDLKKPLDAKKFKTRLPALKDKVVELREVKGKRTIDQNSYLHVCITLFGIEFGYTIDEAKTLLKRECQFMVYEKNNIKFLKRTRDMDTKELSEFTAWIRTYSAIHGCYILSATEYKISRGKIDDEIRANREFL